MISPQEASQFKLEILIWVSEIKRKMFEIRENVTRSFCISWRRYKDKYLAWASLGRSALVLRLCECWLCMWRQVCGHGFLETCRITIGATPGRRWLKLPDSRGGLCFVLSSPPCYVALTHIWKTCIGWYLDWAGFSQIYCCWSPDVLFILWSRKPPAADLRELSASYEVSGSFI